MAKGLSTSAYGVVTRTISIYLTDDDVSLLNTYALENRTNVADLLTQAAIRAYRRPLRKFAEEKNLLNPALESTLLYSRLPRIRGRS